jgi:hypothetical protein
MNELDPGVKCSTRNLRRAVFTGSKWHLRRDIKFSCCGRELPDDKGKAALLVHPADRCKSCQTWPDYNPTPDRIVWQKPRDFPANNLTEPV